MVADLVVEVVAKAAVAKTTLKIPKKTGLFVKEELYSQLPNEVKNLKRMARDGAEKGKDPFGFHTKCSSS